MRYLAFATDYDDTLAARGVVREQTLEALQRVRASGRRVVLVTGRTLDELREACPRLDLFDRVVAENGALLFRPETGQVEKLAESPPPALVERLRARGVDPIIRGRVIVATREPHEATALAVVRELGLELQVIFNKGAVMLLPSGVNKRSGLVAALNELGLSLRNTVAAGDAENDHAMLAAAECGVAVSNALPSLKDRADLVTRAPAGEGIEQLIARLLDDDLRSVVVPRHALLLGRRRDGTQARIAPAGRRILVAGPPGPQRMAAAAAVARVFIESGYQCCAIDPSGQYEGTAPLVTLGSAARVPLVNEVLAVLAKPGVHALVSLAAIPRDEQPAYFFALLRRLQELRARCGRPHWLIVGEADRFFPVGFRPEPWSLPHELGGLLLVTGHSARLADTMLDAVDTAIAVGDKPADALLPLANGARPRLEPLPGEAVCWSNGQLEPLVLGDQRGPSEVPEPPRTRDEPPAARRRSTEAERRARREGRRASDRGYIDGERPASFGATQFVFRGPDGRLSLRAQTLSAFLQLAEGVDEETWLHHLRQNDYSRWFREALRDEALAQEASEIERTQTAASRARIREAVEKRYPIFE